MKKPLVIILTSVSVVTLALALGWLYMYFSYSNSLQGEREAWINDEFIPAKIEGTIYEFNKPSGTNCFSNFIIKKIDGEKFSSGVCVCEDETFSNYASVGDSVLKPAGSTKIFIKKIDGEQKEFDFPFCGY